jgi:hypothetical protein
MDAAKEAASWWESLAWAVLKSPLFWYWPWFCLADGKSAAVLSIRYRAMIPNY